VHAAATILATPTAIGLLILVAFGRTLVLIKQLHAVLLYIAL